MEHVQYPNFKRIEKNDIPIFYSVINRFASYSDFNPVSLLCWNADNNNSYTFLNNNLVIKIKDYLGTGHIYSILGETSIDETIQVLLDKGLQQTKALHMVPEIVVQNVKNKEIFDMQEDRDSFDYVIGVDKMSQPESKNLRKNIDRFLKENHDVVEKRLDLSEAATKDSVIKLTKEWSAKKGFDQQKAEEDLKSVETFIDLSNTISYLAVGVYLKGELIAYTLNEKLNGETAMGHLGKATNEIRHAALYCEHATSKALKEDGIKFINIQQDTGLPGLRETKTSYDPVYFLRKYTIKVR